MKLTNFEDLNKYGLPANFEYTWFLNPANERIMRTKLNFCDVKMKLSFDDMLTDCDVFYEKGNFKSLRFSFYNKQKGDMLWIFYHDPEKENHLVFDKAVYNYQENEDKRTYQLSELDKIWLQIIMKSRYPEGKEIKDLLPELDIVGVYDFQGEDFKRRLALVHMIML